MAKIIKTAEESFRIRRGKLVKIPEEWIGKTVHHRTKKKRRLKREKKNSHD